MSEEFSMSVSFEMDSKEQMDALQTLFEHLDLYETDEARALLAQNRLTEAQKHIEELTSKHSGYCNDDDLVDMYIDTYQDSVNDVNLKIEGSGLKAEINVEGQDHEADDFCAAQVLILIAMGATNIKASGGSPHWFAQWIGDSQGNVSLEFNKEEY